MEKHREIGCPPQTAWNNALTEKRSVLRPPPKCPWWPYVFSVRTRVKVGSDGKVAVGSQRLRVEVPPGAAVIRCQHPNGDVSILKEAPNKEALPQVLLSTRLC